MSRISLDIKHKSSEMLIHSCCIAIDGLVLLFWAAVNFCVDAGLRTFFLLRGADAIIGFVLQVLFGLATLVPIAIFVYRDGRIMWIQANQKVADEQQKAYGR